MNRIDGLRRAAYWTSTLPVAFENMAGSMWVLLPLIPHINTSHTVRVFAQYLQVMLAHLGYPAYFKDILGPWQFACALTLVWPGLARAKEWAYTGAFINYSSACLSHWFVGDGVDTAALTCAVLTVVSWALRPLHRRLTGELSRSSATGILAVLLLLSFLWLPSIPSTR
jgi:DoxX-like protein